jgi:hypothetical protein
MKSFSCFFSVSTLTILGISKLEVFAWNKNVKVEIKTKSKSAFRVTFSISAIQALLSLNANVHNQWYSVNSVDQL